MKARPPCCLLQPADGGRETSEKRGEGGEPEVPVGRILPGLVPVLTRNLSNIWDCHSLLLTWSIESPPWALGEERRSLTVSAHLRNSLPGSIPRPTAVSCAGSTCAVPVPCAAHAAPPAESTHRQFGRSSVCNQSGGARAGRQQPGRVLKTDSAESRRYAQGGVVAVGATAACN